jgi:cell division protein FtsL
MQVESRFTSWRRGTALLLFVIGVVGFVSVFHMSSAARTSNGPLLQQDVIRLENRISQLEQRVYTIENSVRNLEQLARISGANSRGITQDDVGLLRSEIRLLERRLAEDECGLARLDERTLSPAMRVSRRNSSRSNDECRINFDAPLQLPERR